MNDRCFATTQAAGRKHTCRLGADHDLQHPMFDALPYGWTSAHEHHDPHTGHSWQGQPWRVRTPDGETRHKTLDRALRILLPTGGRSLSGVILRPGWTGCLLPAGPRAIDGVDIEPGLERNASISPEDRERWLRAIMLTHRWNSLPKERPLVPNDPEAMERWNDHH